MDSGPFWRFLGAHILTVIAVVLGFLVLVVPGIILAIGLSFVPYLVVDRGLGPIEALKESWRITKGHKWQLLLLFLALVGINLLGVLALIVGIFVTVPITMLAFAHAYRRSPPRRPALTGSIALGRPNCGRPGVCADGHTSYDVSPTDYLADLNASSSVAAAFAVLGDPAAYPVYVHCTFGRDRTLVLAARILSGPRAPAVRRSCSRSAVGGPGGCLSRRSSTAVLDDIDRRGGIEAVLGAAGVTPEQLATLRSRAGASGRHGP